MGQARVGARWHPPPCRAIRKCYPALIRRAVNRLRARESRLPPVRASPAPATRSEPRLRSTGPAPGHRKLIETVPFLLAIPTTAGDPTSLPSILRLRRSDSLGRCRSRSATIRLADNRNVRGGLGGLLPLARATMVASSFHLLAERTVDIPERICGWPPGSRGARPRQLA